MRQSISVEHLRGHITAARVALLASGDIGVACRSVAKAPPRDASISADELARELLTFWVSGDLSALRNHLRR